MLDIKLIRENPDKDKAAMKKRCLDLDKTVDDILEIDRKRRELSTRTDGMKNEQNIASRQIPQMKKEGGDVSPIMAKMKELSEKIKENQQKVADMEEEQKTLLLGLANLPDEDVSAGGKEQNEPIRYFKEKPVFEFEPKNHVEMCIRDRRPYRQSAGWAGKLLKLIIMSCLTGAAGPLS